MYYVAVLNSVIPNIIQISVKALEMPVTSASTEEEIVALNLKEETLLTAHSD